MCQLRVVAGRTSSGRENIGFTYALTQAPGLGTSSMSHSAGGAAGSYIARLSLQPQSSLQQLALSKALIMRGMW